MLERTTCPGCGLERPASGAVYDRKFHASAECWAVFEDVIAGEFQNPALFGRCHQITVDAYAVQHAGGNHPDKSVDVHLCGLYLTMEKGLAPSEVPARLQRLASATKIWPHFELPSERAELTIQDVLLASGTIEGHVAKVRGWGLEVWHGWRIHHEAVRRLALSGTGTRPGS